MMPPPFLSRGFRPRAARHAFVLVIVLIIISVLALVAVAYLSSMSQERATANALANKMRAEQSAQAGVDTAMGILRDYFRTFPDSATVWEAQSTNPDGTRTEGTSLYLRAVPDSSGNLPDPAPNPSDPSANSTGGNGPNNVNASGVDNRKVFVLPLTSGKTPTLQSARNSLPTLAAGSDIDLNSRRFLGDNQGWLGTPPGYTYPSTPNLPKPVRVPWVEIKQQDGYTGTGNTPPVVGRYAFWIEDESFRTNINYAGTGRASDHLRRDNSADAALNPTDLNLLGLLTLLGESDPTTDGLGLVSTRKAYPGQIFPESRAYTHTTGLSATISNGLRYLTTSQSAALNLSRHGTQRLNLNAVIPITAAAVTSAPDVAVAQKQIGKLIKAIAFHAPNFGQRFYRLTYTGGTGGAAAAPANLNALDVSAANAIIYLNKIAANIRDYLDSDSLPTAILPSAYSSPNNNIGQVRANGRPITPINFVDGANPLWALGKDAAPFMQEAAVRFSGSGTGTGYTVNVDYYIEVWNMSTQMVTGQSLGPHAYIRVNNPPKWMGDKKSSPTNSQASLQDGSGHSLSDTRDVTPPGRDFDIDITGAVFPPGVCTVITTDPNWQVAVSPTGSDRSITDPLPANQNEVINNHRFVVCPFISPGKRTYTGSFPTGCDEVRMRYDSSSSSDYETEVVIGNDYGYIDSLAGAIPMNAGIISMPVGSSPRRFTAVICEATSPRVPRTADCSLRHSETRAPTTNSCPSPCTSIQEKQRIKQGTSDLTSLPITQ